MDNKSVAYQIGNVLGWIGFLILAVCIAVAILCVIALAGESIIWTFHQLFGPF